MLAGPCALRRRSQPANQPTDRPTVAPNTAMPHNMYYRTDGPAVAVTWQLLVADGVWLGRNREDGANSQIIKLALHPNGQCSGMPRPSPQHGQHRSAFLTPLRSLLDASCVASRAEGRPAQLINPQARHKQPDPPAQYGQRLQRAAGRAQLRPGPARAGRRPEPGPPGPARRALPGRRHCRASCR